MVRAMDLSSSSPISPTPTSTSPNTNSQTPPPPPPPPPQPPLFPQPIKSLSFAAINGSFNRQQPPKMVVSYSYRECLKNHAATIGGHALDGCGEFMPSPSSLLSDPTSLKCAACGCHRNFHRRHPEDLYHPPRHVTTGIHLLPSRPPPLLLRRNSSPSPSLSPARSSSPGPSPTPSPTPSPHSPPSVSLLPPNYSSSSYFASPPQMLLALSSGLSRPSGEQYQNLMNPTAHKIRGAENGNIINVSNARKRFRTKFSQEQKEKMCLFAEKLGWKMQRSEEKVVEEFCNEVGIRKGVLKVWMHNNKHTLGKRSSSSSADTGFLISRNVINNGTNVDDNHHNPHEEDTDIEKDDEEDHRKANFNFFANGSSSSL